MRSSEVDASQVNVQDIGKENTNTSSCPFGHLAAAFVRREREGDACGSRALGKAAETISSA
jgi:hypothetical protein